MCFNIITMKKIFFIILFSILSCFVLGQGTSTSKFKKVKTDTLTGRTNEIVYISDTIIFTNVIDTLWAIRVSGDTLFLNDDTLYTTTGTGSVSKWGEDGTDIYNLNTNNVRIGELPSDTLDTLIVNGRIRAWNLRNATYKFVIADSSGTLKPFDLPNPSHAIIGGVGQINQEAVWVNDSTIEYGLIYDNRVDSVNIDEHFFLRQDNDFGIDTKLGIGMTDPQYTLDVTGIGNITSHLILGDSLRVEDFTLFKDKVTIDQEGDVIGLLVDSEATSVVGIESYGFKPLYLKQDITGGYALYIERNIAEVGSNPLVTFKSDDATDTQGVLALQSDGSGAHIITLETNENLEINPNGTGYLDVTGRIVTSDSLRVEEESLFKKDVRIRTDLSVGDDVNIVGLENDNSPDSVITVAVGKLYRSFVPGGGIAGKDSLFWSRSASSKLYPKNTTDSVGIGVTTTTSKLEVLGQTTLRTASTDTTVWIRQGAADGRGLIVSRNNNDTETSPLASFVSDHTATTQSTVFIDHQGITGGGIALEVQSDNVDYWTAYVTGNGIYSIQDLADGSGLKVSRNINEVGSVALVVFHNDHATDTKATLELINDGSGAHISTGAINENLEIDPNGTGWVDITGRIVGSDSLRIEGQSFFKTDIKVLDDIFIVGLEDDGSPDSVVTVAAGKMYKSFVPGGGIAGKDSLWWAKSSTLGLFPKLGEDVYITSGTTEKPELTIRNSNADATPGIFNFVKDGGSAGDADRLGIIYFKGDDDAGNPADYASIVGYSEETANGDETGKISFDVSLDASPPALYTLLTLSGDNDTPSQGFIEFNETQKDVDFEVNTTGISALLITGSTGHAVFTGNLTADKYVSDTVVILTSSDSKSVAGASILLVNTNAGHVTIGGLTGGEVGQILHLAVTDATNNTIIEDDEGTGNQDIKTITGVDITITAEGGATFVFQGSYWIMTNIGQ